MERTKQPETEVFVDPDPVIVWKKVGPGSVHFPKRIIKPNETFRARLSEIPVLFRNLFVRADGEPVDHHPPVARSPEDVKNYKIEPRGKSKTWFDIVDTRGKRINEKALTKEKAEELLRDILR